jgi:hypothetical protein
MSPIELGTICGLAFGIFASVIMIPMSFDSKKEKYEALSSAFIDRFMIGFLIPNITLGINPIYTGLILGLGLSLPSAIITRAYAPILIIGAIGGLLIGYLSSFLL